VIKRALNRHAFSIALTAILTATLAAQALEVVWSVSFELTERDKRDILALAADLGLRTPAKVVDDRSSCRLVSVSSLPVVEGNRVTTTGLSMWPRSGTECSSAASDPSSYRRGNWIARKFDGVNGSPSFSNPRRQVAWRVRDGDWHRDLTLGPDVTYEDAQTIVRAIRHRAWVDMRNADDIAKLGPPRLDPDQIFAVARFQDESMKRLFPERYADVYEVMSATHEDFTGRGGGGWVLHVKIRNGRVELHRELAWTS
jgi:hypothetical protein